MGRATGERHVAAKLTTANVMDIRAAHGSQSAREIAAILGVTKGTIQAIWSRRTWRHV